MYVKSDLGLQILQAHGIAISISGTVTEASSQVIPLAPQQMHNSAPELTYKGIINTYDAIVFQTMYAGSTNRDQARLLSAQDVEGLRAHQKQWLGTFEQHAIDVGEALLKDGAERWNRAKRERRPFQNSETAIGIALAT